MFLVPDDAGTVVVSVFVVVEAMVDAMIEKDSESSVVVLSDWAQPPSTIAVSTGSRSRRRSTGLPPHRAHPYPPRELSCLSHVDRINDERRCLDAELGIVSTAWLLQATREERVSGMFPMADRVLFT
jgi:hypothetical protein